MLEPAQIVRAAQIWVCDTCGGEDHKSCGCNSTARMQALQVAAARHADRNERERQRIKAKRAAVVGNADVENVEEKNRNHIAAWAKDRAAEDPDISVSFPRHIAKSNQRSAILMNCHAATRIAREELANYEGPVDAEIRRACRQTAEAWTQLANKLDGR